jgi:16S rRNA (cytidine1402-2'-O)-methyltransferase
VLAALRGADRTVVFYESPRRVVALLREIAAALDDPEVAVGRELTKLHEEVVRGRASDVAERLAAKGPRGEMAIAAHVPATTSDVAGDDDLTEEVRTLVEAGLSARDIAERMKARGVPRRRVYDIVSTVRDERG